MSNPTVTIAIPSFNGVEVLPDCIESCLNQKYKDIEVIVVNDGSTDSTQDILDYYAKKDSRVKPIKIKHSGISIARQTAVDNAKGEYIAIMDTDCQMEPTRLIESLKAIKNADIVYSEYIWVLRDGRIARVTPEDMSGKQIKDILDRKYPNSNQIVPNFTVMAKKECFKNVYRSEFKVNDDLIMVLEWMKRKYKFKLIKKPLVMHFETGYNVSSSKYKEVLKITNQLRKEEGI